jgi:hypothetical protein
MFSLRKRKRGLPGWLALVCRFQGFNYFFYQALDDTGGIGISEIKDDMVSASGDVALNCIVCGIEITRIDNYLYGASDGSRIASNGIAVAIENGTFVIEVVDGATCEIPDSGVASDYTQS